LIDFVNLKIKLAQSFKDAHRGRVYVHVGECSYFYEYVFILYFYKKKLNGRERKAE
jgi:hypothetical protein